MVIKDPPEVYTFKSNIVILQSRYIVFNIFYAKIP